ncbi:amino acid ABC transporter substrate-binding protein [Pikeienuella piscinae]|uniref:Amino acid ABC transporter substrate-binding protein n=1 Tax=Pikeienuella piscinae TaxID=2748098 RepID=A0A7L5BVF5_9RHOB|nr:amino acid ABC transporter substrate-binding protein [Pikeienuella piscinae]QIE56340.1 amino acid ABC transporter substrate-binding protein [Pikeienuella piscinae]
MRIFSAFRLVIPVALFGVLAAPPVLADALDQIEESGVIRLGVREASAPFSYRDENGEPAGLAIALCKRVADSIAARLGRESLALEFVTVDSETRFDALLDGRVDLHCGPMTASLSRRETLDFSIPYFMDGIGAALRRDGVQEIEALAGEPVGALNGTTGVAMARHWGEPGGSPIIEFESHRKGLEALGRGEIDVYFGDQGLLLHQLDVLKREDRLIPIRVIEDQFSYEPYSLAMKAGERRLRLEVDRGLSTAFLDRTVFDDIDVALGEFQLSELAAFLYVLVALPE